MTASDRTTHGSVLLVTPRWTRDGGVGAHVQVSAVALAEHGVNVHVLAAQLDAGGEPPSGVTLHEAPALFDSNAPMDARLGGLRPAADAVVHLHQVDDPKIAVALRRSAPVAVSAHGYTACTSGVYYFDPGQECTRGHGVGCVPNLLARGCAHTRYRKTLPRKFVNATRGRAALRAADVAVSYSSAVDRHLAANGLQRRAIVPYFPTMAPQRGSGHEHRRRVVFAGRMVVPKGVDVLLRAAAEVDAEFVLCGEGRELEAMRALATQLGVQERVRFSGWLDADGLAHELAEASLLVLPSLWPEPFGIVGIEAFAAGRPAVASASGGVRDWLEDGTNGIAVPPGDVQALARALDELLSDPDRQRRMGEAGRETVARSFTPAHHVAALLEAYAGAREHWRATREGG
jgi:glycosyltransferase involved in cell wall biosynthesis